MQEKGIYSIAVIELIRSLRTVKRQLVILKNVELENEERNKILAAINAVSEEFDIFRI